MSKNKKKIAFFFLLIIISFVFTIKWLSNKDIDLSVETLELLLEVFGNRQSVIARELTKLNEEYIRGSLVELNQIDEATLKGEMVVLVEGNQSNSDDISDERIIERIKYYLNYKIEKKTAIELVKNELNVGKNRVYKLAMDL